MNALLHFEVSDRFGRVSRLVNISRHAVTYSDTRGLSFLISSLASNQSSGRTMWSTIFSLP